jgi:hypothetical protein
MVWVLVMKDFSREIRNPKQALFLRIFIVECTQLRVMLREDLTRQLCPGTFQNKSANCCQFMRTSVTWGTLKDLPTKGIGQHLPRNVKFIFKWLHALLTHRYGTKSIPSPCYINVTWLLINTSFYHLNTHVDPFHMCSSLEKSVQHRWKKISQQDRVRQDILMKSAVYTCFKTLFIHTCVYYI